MNEPLILDIKHHSLDDGPGIRTTLFLKGCPLRCVWCHNPESKKSIAELSFDSLKCIGCKVCEKSCPNNAIVFHRGMHINRSLCTNCFKCTEHCPSKALSKIGFHMDKEEVIKDLMKDQLFYEASKGGVTFSGGEATLFAEWVGSIASMLKEAEIHVLLETCGYFDFDTVAKKILPYLDMIYCDIKLFDSSLHRKYCGVDNALILENLEKLTVYQKQYGYTLLPRVPLIPGITDTNENIASIAQYLQKIGLHQVELLPYNPTWYTKSDKIGIELDAEIAVIKTWQSDEKINDIKAIFLSYGLEC